MGKETYQITEYVHDQVIAHCIAFGLIGTDEPKEDKNNLIDFYELESFNPPDTIQVATFFLEKTSTKKKYIIMSALFRKNLLKRIIKKDMYFSLLCGWITTNTGLESPGTVVLHHLNNLYHLYIKRQQIGC